MTEIEAMKRRFHLLISSALVAIAATAPQGASAADTATISHGERVDLSAHLASGKYTLVDFYADWCAPCRMLEPQIERLADVHESSLAVRKVDIVNWQSEVSKQYRVFSIPHLKLYDPQGRLLSEGQPGVVLATLQAELGVASPEAGSGGVAPFLVIVTLIAVASALLFLKGRQPAAAGAAASSGPPIAGLRGGESAEAADPEAVWFVMLQGSLEGPLTIAQLEDLEKRRCIDSRARVRRRGDATWQTLADLI